MAQRLVLCRHTQTDHNRERIYSGQIDIDLNETGIKQAETVARQIASLPGVCGVLSSNLIRARKLGLRIGELAGVGVKLTDDLREVHLGVLQGFRKEEFPQLYRGEQFNTSNPAFDFTLVGGEKAADVIARYMRALAKAQRYFDICGMSDARVVVVGHGTALRLVFRDYLGLFTGKLHEQGEYQEVPWTL